MLRASQTRAVLASSYKPCGVPHDQVDTHVVGCPAHCVTASDQQGRAQIGASGAQRSFLARHANVQPVSMPPQPAVVVKSDTAALDAAAHARTESSGHLPALMMLRGAAPSLLPNSFLTAHAPDAAGVGPTAATIGAEPSRPAEVAGGIDGERRLIRPVAVHVPQADAEPQRVAASAALRMAAATLAGFTQASGRGAHSGQQEGSGGSEETAEPRVAGEPSALPSRPVAVSKVRLDLPVGEALQRSGPGGAEELGRSGGRGGGAEDVESSHPFAARLAPKPPATSWRSQWSSLGEPLQAVEAEALPVKEGWVGSSSSFAALRAGGYSGAFGLLPRRPAADDQRFGSQGAFQPAMRFALPPGLLFHPNQLQQSSGAMQVARSGVLGTASLAMGSNSTASAGTGYAGGKVSGLQDPDDSPQGTAVELAHMLPKAARGIECLLPSRPFLHNPYVVGSGAAGDDLALSKMAQTGCACGSKCELQLLMRWGRPRLPRLSLRV
jgi:hypothetical protein